MRDLELQITFHKHSDAFIIPEKQIQEWVVNLRSGEFVQGPEFLYVAAENQEKPLERFCCLGLYAYCVDNIELETLKDEGGMKTLSEYNEEIRQSSYIQYDLDDLLLAKIDETDIKIVNLAELSLNSQEYTLTVCTKRFSGSQLNDRVAVNFYLSVEGIETRAFYTSVSMTFTEIADILEGKPVVKTFTGYPHPPYAITADSGSL